jgi:hypothetical protein
MMVNNWQFDGSGTNMDPNTRSQFPYLTNAGAIGPANPPTSSYGDLTNLIGAPGQNSPTPSVKTFFFHQIITVDPSLLSTFNSFVPAANGTSLCFDPSYGLQYSGALDFETQAIAGYLTSYVNGFGSAVYDARQRSAISVNTTLTPCTLAGSPNPCY